MSDEIYGCEHGTPASQWCYKCNDDNVKTCKVTPPASKPKRKSAPTTFKSASRKTTTSWNPSPASATGYGRQFHSLTYLQILPMRLPMNWNASIRSTPRQKRQRLYGCEI